MIQKITEQESNHQDLEKKTTWELISAINEEDKTVPIAVEKALPEIKQLVDLIYHQMSNGGRLFYIGAGTSGRLGILDASECPPTFGVPHDLVIGVIAGGDIAIRKSVEHAEDDTDLAWKDLSEYNINEQDAVVGIAASGTTPYVVHGLKKCQENKIPTGCITCNPGAPLTDVADAPVVVVVGPEFLTGSSRMKAGTAQKLVLNMLTTSVMIKLGRVKGNRMVDMQLSNDKLWDRGTRMVVEKLGIPYDEARLALENYKSVRAVINHYQSS